MPANVNKLNYTIKIDKNNGLLVLEPNESFLSWVKTAAIQYNINSSEIERNLSKNTLANHSVVIVTPVFSTENEQISFIKKNLDVLFTTMIDSWVFPPECWPTDRSELMFKQMFRTIYFNFVVDVFNTNEDADGMSLFVVKPKQPAAEWFHRLYSEDKIAITDKTLLNPEMFKKTGQVSSVGPAFPGEEEITLFIKQNYSRLFDYALSKYCSDESLWIQDRSYEQFIKWFECCNYSPIFSRELWEHPEIMQHLRDEGN